MADIKFIVGGYVRVERVIKGRYSHLMYSSGDTALLMKIYCRYISPTLKLAIYF